MMAMTKKERAAMQAAIDRAELLAALRWTAPVERDVPPPTAFGAYSEGWEFNAHTGTVDRGWSTMISHGRGPTPDSIDKYRSGSQGARWMFSTRARAVAAMRHEIEILAAKRLLACDRLSQSEET